MGEPTQRLDPAAGRCEFINAIPAAERWAVDTVDHGKPRIPVSRRSSGTSWTLSFRWPISTAIFVSNFLEHLPSRNRSAGCSRMLGRRWSPAGPSPSSARTSGIVQEYFDCADHTLAPTHVAAAEHVYAAGFEITAVIPRFLPYSFNDALPLPRC